MDKIPIKNKNLAWRIIDGEAVVVNLENQPDRKEEIFIFNHTATRVWQLCNGKNMLEDIILKLGKEYASKGQDLAGGVERIINQMYAQRLLSG
jgi:hypothetical protein